MLGTFAVVCSVICTRVGWPEGWVMIWALTMVGWAGTEVVADCVVAAPKEPISVLMLEDGQRDGSGAWLGVFTVLGCSGAKVEMLLKVLSMGDWPGTGALLGLLSAD